MTQSSPSESTDRLDRIERSLEALTGQVSRVPEIDRKLEALTEQVSRVSEDVGKLRVDLATERRNLGNGMSDSCSSCGIPSTFRAM